MKHGFFINGMRLFVCFLNACPLYLANYELNTWIENEMDQRILKLTFNFAIFMALSSYWIASLKRPKQIPAVPQNAKVEMCGQC